MGEEAKILETNTPIELDYQDHPTRRGGCRGSDSPYPTLVAKSINFRMVLSGIFHH